MTLHKDFQCIDDIFFATFECFINQFHFIIALDAWMIQKVAYFFIAFENFFDDFKFRNKFVYIVFFCSKLKKSICISFSDYCFTHCSSPTCLIYSSISLSWSCALISFSITLLAIKTDNEAT